MTSSATAIAAARAILATADTPAQPAYDELTHGERQIVLGSWQRSGMVGDMPVETYYARVLVPERSASMAQATARARADLTLAAELRAARGRR